LRRKEIFQYRDGNGVLLNDNLTLTNKLRAGGCELDYLVPTISIYFDILAIVYRRSKVTQRRLPLFTIIAQGRLLGDNVIKKGTQRAIYQHETTFL
jgi:hypothetical protein